MAVTLKDVAQHAGVSRSAVSRTFTDGASVSAKTRKVVEKSARELGYRPSLIARSLATNRTKLIGLVTNNFENPLYLEVFDLFTSELQKRGFRSLIVNLSEETDPEKTLELLHQYNVDGVIVAGSTLPEQISKSLAHASIPVVHTLSSLDDDLHVVGTDDLACGQLAAQTLAACNYENVALIGAPQDSKAWKIRMSGFKKTAAQLGIKVVKSVHADAYSYSGGQTAWDKLSSTKNIEAVFAADDIICMGAMDRARELGARIPDDLGFLGVNDLTMASWSSYALTTIKQPIRDMIISTSELVIALVDDPTRSPETRKFPLKLVERNTLKQQV